MEELRLIDNMTCKRCARCHKYKSLYEFNMQHGERRLKRQPYCRECQHEYAKENYASSGGKSIRLIEESTCGERTAYQSLYEAYRTFRKRLNEYKEQYDGKGIEERMSFEFELGF